LKGLATAVTILLAITGLCSAVGLFAFLHRASVADDLTRLFKVTEAQQADDRVRATMAFFQLSLLATGVLWIIWQFRHAKNAQALRGNYGLPPGWAIGGWFIPLGNFVLPQLQLLQAARASDPDLPAGQPASSGSVPGVVPVWWAAYDGAAVLFAIGALVRPNLNDFAPDIDRFVQADRLSALAMALYVLAAILGIVMVRTLTARQERAMASIGSSPAPQGYGQTWQPPPPQAPPPSMQQWPPAPGTLPPPPEQWPPAPGAPPPSP
jgi:hypothetical protein